MSNNEERKESPTQNRLKKAKKSGMNTYSKELNSLISCISFLIMFFFLKKIIIFNIIKIFMLTFSFNQSITNENFLYIIKNIFFIIKNIFIIFFSMFFCLMILSIFSPLLSKNFLLSFKMIEFNFKKLNFFYGLSQIFSFNIFFEFFKVFFKIFISFVLIGLFFLMFFLKYINLFYCSFYNALLNGIILISFFYIVSLIAFIPSVIFDVFFSNYLYYKKLKMSHQELKDEIKNSEGNPEIKTKIREKIRSILKENSTSEIYKSDVLIFDVRGYSVCLKYDKNFMTAPKIISKGIGEFAFNTLKLAKKYNIPIFESSQITKILYENGEVGKDIPGIFYSVISEIFAWLLELKKWRKKGGKYPKSPKYLHIPFNLNILGKNKK
ncbi:MAG: hypothetical protein G8D27_00050 [Buchnera aphidicola (Periphyllus aceris)]|nr:hypothetical protein [Buchnera aphidicola (Periphyllus aceris)]